MKRKEIQHYLCVPNVLVLATLVVAIGADLNAQNTTPPPNPKLVNPPIDSGEKTQTRALPGNQQQGMRRQANQQTPTKQMKRPPNPNAKQKVEIPKPEHMVLDTKDGVRLHATYFAPPKVQAAQEEPKPVLSFILLHEWDSDRRQLLNYALFLQQAGHAAIVPDLRGHGGSVEVVGRTKPIDYEKFRKADVMSAEKDIERCKKFLVQRHNKEELNVDLLCVVAVGDTSVLAVQWVLNDWFAFPARNPQGIKQGQDVKALMLISPVKKLAGVSMLPNLKHPMFSGETGAGLPLMVVWGASEETADETETIVNNLEKGRPDLSQIQDPNERLKQTSFFSVPITKQKFSGAQMIERQRVQGFWPYISNLLFEQKVAAYAKQFPWETREPKKLEDDE